MKPKGCRFEYTDQRDRELMNAYRNQLDSCQKIILSKVLTKTVNSPASRFWVSEYRAATVISQMYQGKQLSGMKPMKVKMFTEIFNRVKALHLKSPDRSLNDIVCEIVNQPAPQFYITPTSAKIIIFRIKKKWLEERKKKLRHLFY